MNRLLAAVRAFLETLGGAPYFPEARSSRSRASSGRR